MLRINQVLSRLLSYDAIGDEALIIRDLLRMWGYESNIYAEKASDNIKNEILDLQQLNDNSSDILIYHYGGFDNVFRRIINLKCKKIMVYHNITPSTYKH